MLSCITKTYACKKQKETNPKIQIIDFFLFVPLLYLFIVINTMCYIILNSKP